MKARENGFNAKDAVAGEQEPLGDVAYQELLPELKALKEEELQVINLPLAAVVSTVIGAVPGIERLIPDIQKAEPEIAAIIGKLRPYALALSYAHARYLAARTRSSDLPKLIEHGLALRETLLADVTALVGHGLIAQTKLRELRGSVGHQNVATDLTILATVLQDQWAEIQGRCPVSLDDIAKALRFAERILTEVGAKDRRTAETKRRRICASVASRLS